MITDEQIIGILKSWAVNSAHIQTGNFINRLTLISPTGEFMVDINIFNNFSPSFEVIKKTESGYRPIYSVQNISKDITSEFIYLFERRSKEYVKRELDRMLKSEVSGLDALL